MCTAKSVCPPQQAVHRWWEAHKTCVAMQVAARRAEAVKWQQMQQAHSTLQSQQDQLIAEIQEWKARYRDEAAYSSELQAAANRLQSELTAAQLESQVCGIPLFSLLSSFIQSSTSHSCIRSSILAFLPASIHLSIHLFMRNRLVLRWSTYRPE